MYIKFTLVNLRGKNERKTNQKRSYRKYYHWRSLISYSDFLCCHKAGVSLCRTKMRVEKYWLPISDRHSVSVCRSVGNLRLPWLNQRSRESESRWDHQNFPQLPPPQPRNLHTATFRIKCSKIILDGDHHARLSTIGPQPHNYELFLQPASHSLLGTTNTTFGIPINIITITTTTTMNDLTADAAPLGNAPRPNLRFYQQPGYRTQVSVVVVSLVVKPRLEWVTYKSLPGPVLLLLPTIQCSMNNAAYILKEKIK